MRLHVCQKQLKMITQTLCVIQKGFIHFIEIHISSCIGASSVSSILCMSSMMTQSAELTCTALHKANHLNDD